MIIFRYTSIRIGGLGIVLNTKELEAPRKVAISNKYSVISNISIKSQPEGFSEQDEWFEDDFRERTSDVKEALR